MRSIDHAIDKARLPLQSPHSVSLALLAILLGPPCKEMRNNFWASHARRLAYATTLVAARPTLRRLLGESCPIRDG